MADEGVSWLGEDTVGTLRPLGTRKRLPAGSTLFFEGEQPYDVVVIDKGQVKVTTVALSGQELVLDVAGPGDVLGELSAIDGEARSATAVAMTDVEVTCVAAERFRSFLEGTPDAMRSMLEQTIARLRLANRRQLEYSSSDALGRVCARLDELARRQSDNGAPLQLGLTQTELAQWCGLSREAVVKALRKLRTLGWISTDNGAMAILESEQLHDRGQI